MHDRTVLISGCGIAGPTLAWFLAEEGSRPTIVERDKKLPSSGSPVDVRGEAVRIARQMGVYEALRAHATGAARVVFVDAAARHRASFAIQSSSEAVELPRGDLAAVLHGACRERAEVIFGDTIASLADDESGVDVTFEHGAPRRFDLVVGADGLHSTVRRIAFGPEPTFVRHAGFYFATVRFDVPLDDLRSVLVYNAPGRAVALHPCGGKPRAAFIFRRGTEPFRDPRALIGEVYAHDGWRVPEFLDHLATANDLYFDSVSQVRIEPWHRGRVALAGDAAACLSLFGDGSTLAMRAGATLARALHEEATAAGAFTRYQAAHRRHVTTRRIRFPLVAAFLVPKTSFGIAARNALGWLSAA